MSHNYEFSVMDKKADKYDDFIAAVLKKVTGKQDRKTLIFKLAAVIKSLIDKQDEHEQESITNEVIERLEYKRF